MNTQESPKLAIVVPCFNEEDVLSSTAEKLSQKLQNLKDNNMIAKESKIIFVDDGSKDKTWNLIVKFHEGSPAIFGGIKLSRNKGHQNALLCGLLTIKHDYDITITIDADLQDDINAIDQMIVKYISGCEIVYGVRSNRKKDSFFKRSTAQGFYRLMSFLGVDLVYNHADFRLLGKNAIEAFSEYKEVNIFLRGIVPLLGFKSDVVYYTRAERTAGISKYPFKKMLQFALEGIFSFSIKPIRFIAMLGILIFGISIAMIVYFIIKYFTGHTISGWASIACSIWGIGGLILFSIGIVGEYIGKIYLETKNRPRFHVEDVLLERI